MHITKKKSEYRMTEEKSHNLGEFRKKHNTIYWKWRASVVYT